MCKMYLSMIVSLVVILLIVAVSDPVQAKPSWGGSCINCHASGTGDMDINPDPIDIAIDSNGVLSFDILALPSPGNENRIALEGLENSDLDATVLPGGDNWTWTTGSQGSSYISDAITITEPYTLDLGIGPNAVENPYSIVAYLAGKNSSGASYSFNVNVVPEPSADFDTDGDVDGADFLRWQRGFGTIGGASKGQGDANVDGNVNADDLAIWQTQYGIPPPLSVVNSIPEPTTLVLAMFGAASACCWRRNR